MNKTGAFIKKVFNIKYQESLLVIVIIVITLILVYSKLTPGIYEINPHDGAKYIQSGRFLLTSGFRSLSWGPFVALVYAPVDLFVSKSLNWFMLEAWVGNFILFSLIWLSFYYLARQLKYSFAPYIMMGLMITLTAVFRVLENQSDAVFLALSAFALANLLKFKSTGLIKYLWFSSIFVGLGIFVRVETIILVGTLLILGTVIGIKKFSFPKLLITCILPSALLLSGFAIVNLIMFGTPNFSIAGRSYDSLQWNQITVSGGDLDQAYQQSDQLFGTKEENNGSVIKAIIHNPKAIMERVLANAKNLPEGFLQLSGRFQGFLILLFSAWGIFTLIKEKETLLLVILLTWPLHVLIVLVFFAGHFYHQIMYIFYLIPTIGICSFYGNKTNIYGKFTLLVVSVLTLVFSIIDQRQNLLIGSSLLGLSIVADILLGSRLLFNKSIRIIPVLLLLIIAISFRQPFSFPEKVIGNSPLEKAVQYLEITLPEQSTVLAYVPIPAIAAKMKQIGFDGMKQFENDPEMFIGFIEENDIQAILLDGNYQPDTQVLVGNYINSYPSYFIHSFESEDGLIDIYLVRDD